MSRPPFRSALAGLALVALACTTGYGYTDPATLEYDPALGVDLAAMNSHPSGLYWSDVEEGEGEAASRGDTVAIRYREYLPDGDLVTQNWKSGEPEVFRISAGRVIAGWEIGVLGMREGGVRRLVLPPQLAWADLGRGREIPGDQVVVYEIQLVEVR